ncbi:MAG: hypothetical protein WA001_00530 [Patescibacteria group bacterium]
MDNQNEIQEVKSEIAKFKAEQHEDREKHKRFKKAQLKLALLTATYFVTVRRTVKIRCGGGKTELRELIDPIYGVSKEVGVPTSVRRFELSMRDGGTDVRVYFNDGCVDLPLLAGSAIQFVVSEDRGSNAYRVRCFASLAEAEADLGKGLDTDPPSASS